MTENTTPTTASIELLGKAYQIKCQENEIPALQKAAAFLNSTMKSMPQAAGRPLAAENLGIMAALNLASRILELEEHMSRQASSLNQRLLNMQNWLDNVLSPGDATTSFRLEVESAQA